LKGYLTREPISLEAYENDNFTEENEE